MKKFRLVIQDCSHCLDLISSKNTKKAMICGTTLIYSIPNEIQGQNPASLEFI